MTRRCGDDAPALSLAEIQRLVRAASSALRLEVDGDPGGKGRYLVACRPLRAGEAFLSERPLFRGSTDGAQSQKVYLEDFVALAAGPKDQAGDSSDEEGDPADDRLHPCSPLLDCVAGVLLERRRAFGGEDEAQRARALLRLRQLAALCRAESEELVPEACAADIFGVLRPEFQGLTSEDEVRDLVHAISSNRFGGGLNQLDLMFTGSMFEHSCTPNCFVGSWRGAGQGTPAPQVVSFRALRDVAEGEALSIDYVQLPDAYLAAAGRAAVLGPWGFQCTCPRCTDLPELTRAFLCAACGAPELCPVSPRPGAELRCRACGVPAEAAYAARCLAAEARAGGGFAQAEPTAEPEAEPDDRSDVRLLGRHHHAVFEVVWAHVSLGPVGNPEGTSSYKGALEALIQSVSRLYGDPCHPQLLDLYHAMAELHEGNLEGQRRWLDFERGVIKRCYPEEIEKQDQEILAMVQGRPPFAPEAPVVPAASGHADGPPGVQLSALD
ncbi:unnamed protein product [Prorocentrum cordatum]|uniref:SET domain-containing protein n=1 Tax=Prorocentrum cordatum TaxID=2364126 RepID=A0ABN9PWX9_9DINO|nr:unnamed protein product [Polarella glacialis]